jgi:7-carboxy-7-deazaguanine synthase (Cx14CxxC type)
VSYAVKEIYYTLQGEGAQTGRAAVFLRFAGCNLWTGRDSDRTSAICRFCDTDFVGLDGPGGGRFATAADLAAAVEATWPHAGASGRYVVCTGGEPSLQLDVELIDALHERGFTIAIETNGTNPLPTGIDWVCVSPKGSSTLVVNTGDELKLVYPQVEPEAQPTRFDSLGFTHFFLQPLDGPDAEASTAATLRYCLDHPQWRLGLQTHKVLSIP